MIADNYLGEIRAFAGNYAPAGWALCEGQVLPISEFEALYTLVGTAYGGNGQTTFGLPDLRGRVADAICLSQRRPAAPRP
jgi:microcystin-dependent protein